MTRDISGLRPYSRYDCGYAILKTFSDGTDDAYCIYNTRELNDQPKMVLHNVPEYLKRDRLHVMAS